MAVRDTFSCEECGSCCRWPGHVLLGEADLARLAGALRLSERDFADRYTRLASNRSQLSLTECEDGSCIFLENDRCAVYESRPDQCRTFPHTWHVEGPCPGQDDQSPILD